LKVPLLEVWVNLKIFSLLTWSPSFTLIGSDSVQPHFEERFMRIILL
jgi:hypothetical protein